MEANELFGKGFSRTVTAQTKYQTQLRMAIICKLKDMKSVKGIMVIS